MAKAKKDEEFQFEIVKHYCDLSDPNEKGWRKEFNLVKWGDIKEPLYDIRSWNKDHTRMSKGIALNYDELAILASKLFDEGIC